MYYQQEIQKGGAYSMAKLEVRGNKRESLPLQEQGNKERKPNYTKGERPEKTRATKTYVKLPYWCLKLTACLTESLASSSHESTLIGLLRLNTVEAALALNLNFQLDKRGLQIASLAVLLKTKTLT